MPSISYPEGVFIALFLLAPGFWAVLLAIELGVVERRPSKYELFGISIFTSVIIDSLFLMAYQLYYNTVQSLSRIDNIFFTDGFKPELVFGLLILSTVTGLLLAAGITYRIPEQARNLLWSKQDTSRYPRQPWEGILEDAHEVSVITTDEELVNGALGEHSRVEKERQLEILDPAWYTDGELKEHGEKSTILFQDDIRRLSVISYKSNEPESEEE